MLKRLLSAINLGTTKMDFYIVYKVAENGTVLKSFTANTKQDVKNARDAAQNHANYLVDNGHTDISLQIDRGLKS